jgi:hypothetical protein
MGDKKVCFVIMGYGVKTDYSTGRQLDLDKTYKNIIKPAVEELGLTCMRADELRHSGIIDWHMYKYLINADVVIADLSTYNPNAFYELGVRHALRPFTTIAIAESDLKEPFDVNHTVIRKYEHLGKGIDYDEVIRFQEEIKNLIQEILIDPKMDSPVYTYLKGLKQPMFEEIEAEITQTSEKETLSIIIENANKALAADDFIQAKVLYGMGHKIDENNTFLLQKLVLSTYKSKFPDNISALKEALVLLERLNPESTTDPETLGLAGAIYKRFWEDQHSKNDLDKSIYFYEKGFYIKNDYYNGINLAFLFNVRGSLDTGNEAVADYVLANRVRKEVVKICTEITEGSNFIERDDQYWVWATLEEAYFALGSELDNLVEYTLAKEEALRLVKSDWERQSTESQIQKLKELLEK